MGGAQSYVMKYLTLILLAVSMLVSNCKKDKEDDTLTNLLLLNFLVNGIDSGTAVVTTLAGSLSESGYTDGSGTSARFNGMDDITIDSSGNLFVIDGNKNGSYTYRIRKISSSGEVTTFAGNGSNTQSDGTGTSAGFIFPFALTIDSSNNIYILNLSATTRIRKIAPNAVVTTPAFGDGGGFLNGSSSAFRMSSPYDLVTDLTNNLYIVDSNNHAIRKMTTTGFDVTTFAGAAPPTALSGSSDGTGNAARFNKPRPIAIDSSGNLYIGDGENYKIRKITPSGVVTTLAGSGTQGYKDGSSSEAQFGLFTGLVCDKSGNVYVAERSSIRKITSDGTVSVVAGRNSSRGTGEGSTSKDGVGTGARFRNITGLTIDSSDNIYATDGDAIRKIVP